MPNELRDLTSFFLEWQDACAIDKCPTVKTKICDNGAEVPLRIDGKLVYKCTFKNDGESDEDYVARIQADVAHVHAIFDASFAKWAYGLRRPNSGKGRSAAKGLMSLSEFSNLLGSQTHAFHLVELRYYGRDSIKGIPFKQHLFESAALQNGVGYLNGYFLETLWQIVKDSFSGSANTVFAKDKDGNPIDLINVVDPDRILPGSGFPPNGYPGMGLDMEECVESSRKLLGKYWSDNGIASRLALLCDTFQVPRSTPEIVAASGLKQSAFYLRKPYQSMRADFDAMAEDFGMKAVRHVFLHCIRDIVEKLGRSDPDCEVFFNVLEKLQPDAGETSAGGIEE